MFFLGRVAVVDSSVAERIAVTAVTPGVTQ